MPNIPDNPSRNLSNNQTYPSISNQYSSMISKIDLSLEGYNRIRQNQFICDGNYNSVENQVKLWLMHEADDLIREGDNNYVYTLFNILGKRIDPNTLSEMSNNLKNEFNRRGYSTDIDLVYLNLKPDYVRKIIFVDFIAKSKVNGQIEAGSTSISPSGETND